MKYLFLTEENSEGLSEVFHAFLLPEEFVPQEMIDRWNTLVSSSPITARIFENKENVAIGSIWDEEAQELILTEGADLDEVLPVDQNYLAFFINNVLTGAITATKSTHTLEKFRAAVSRPITVVSLDDESDPDIGYIYNGVSFSEPENV
jgi:hypothetical protein